MFFFLHTYILPFDTFNMYVPAISLCFLPTFDFKGNYLGQDLTHGILS